MYKESEVNLDDIVKALLESELGFLLLQSDNNCKNMYYQKKVHTRTGLGCLAITLI